MLKGDLEGVPVGADSAAEAIRLLRTGIEYMSGRHELTGFRKTEVVGAMKRAAALLATLERCYAEQFIGDARPVQAFLSSDGRTLILTGDPPDEPDDYEPTDDDHHCDFMGCQLSHVLYRIDLEEL